jgi:hypothetical protein
MQERRTNKIGRKNDENINERKKENRNIHLLRLSGTKELLSRNKMERNVRCSLFFLEEVTLVAWYPGKVGWQRPKHANGPSRRLKWFSETVATYHAGWAALT